MTIFYLPVKFSPIQFFTLLCQNLRALSTFLPFYFFFPVIQIVKIKKQPAIQHLKFLNEYIVPFNYQFQNTTVGGLSGIDYNPRKK